MNRFLRFITPFVVCVLCVSHSFAIGTPPPPSRLAQYSSSKNIPAFTLRNGLTWYASFEDCVRKVSEENVPFKTTEDNDEMRENLYKAYPQEKEKREIWGLAASVTFEREDEEVMLGLMGTKKNGLIEITYSVVNYVDRNKRLEELKASLEKKYGSFEVHRNIQEYSYMAFRKFSNYTVSIYTLKDNARAIFIMYAPPERESIFASLNDGSYYITTPYGL